MSRASEMVFIEVAELEPERSPLDPFPPTMPTPLAIASPDPLHLHARGPLLELVGTKS